LVSRFGRVAMYYLRILWRDSGKPRQISLNIWVTRARLVWRDCAQSMGERGSSVRTTCFGSPRPPHRRAVSDMSAAGCVRMCILHHASFLGFILWLFQNALSSAQVIACQWCRMVSGRGSVIQATPRSYEQLHLEGGGGVLSRRTTENGHEDRNESNRMML
jgi:hypothetical protein